MAPALAAPAPGLAAPGPVAPGPDAPAPDAPALDAPIAAAPTSDAAFSPASLATASPALGFDPAALAAPGAPLLQMAAADPVGAVTSSTQVQAMAADVLPGGLGRSAFLGALILASLAGLALRHRVLTRERARRRAEG